MNTINTPIGEFVRGIRESKKISLRQFAKDIGKTPTFVSRFERGDDMVPSEETLQMIAAKLGIDSDELVFMAKRVPSDLPEIVQRSPVEMAALLRTAGSMTPEQLKKLNEYATRKAKP